MKAILVIDEMPTECIECPFHRLYLDGWANEETHCSLTAKRNKDGVHTKAEWCPLKSMPMEFTVEKLSEEEQDSTKMLVEMAIMKVYADGWNDCLKEINETEKTT